MDEIWVGKIKGSWALAIVALHLLRKFWLYPCMTVYNIMPCLWVKFLLKQMFMLW